MKNRLRISIGMLALLLLITTGIVLAADTYTIPWWSVDSGAGTSSGGAFTLSGTIGQHDTGTMTGGNFKLNGGFWNAEGAEIPSPSSTQNEVYLPFVTK